MIGLTEVNEEQARRLVPPAKSLGRLLAPLRGAAAPPGFGSATTPRRRHPKPQARSACL